jgi:NitT/TauT family transport system substrate-binding protein
MKKQSLLARLSLAASLMTSTMNIAHAAEGNEIRIIGSYGLQFLPTYVAIDNKLIEKHAKAQGIADPKVTFTWVTNGGAINDALISDNSDVGEVPGPALVLLWNKTRGATAVRGILAGSEIPPVLVTIDPHIKTIDDYGEKDRIAMPTVKISSYAIMMQMAAEQHYGWENRFKFDPISVPLNFAETVAVLMSGGTEIKSAIVVPPFSEELLESGKVRQILSLDDVLGGHGTLNVFSTTERFHSEHPKAYAAVKAALIEAIEFINKDPHAAAEVFQKREPNKHGVDWIEKLIRNKTMMTFTPDPHHFGKLAAFLYKTGTIKAEPTSWKDLFFDQGAGLNGN